MNRNSACAPTGCIFFFLLAVLAAGPAAAGRVLLVGLDGASWNVIDPMIEAGELPEIAAIAAEGVTADLATVEPVTSPVVWTSIATGRSPEHHGVTDFFSNATRIATPTVFERLAAQGKRVGLYDYLMTWPPTPLPGGFVIPGWLRRDDSVAPSDVWTRAELTPWVNAYKPLRTNDDYRHNAMAETREKPARWNALAAQFDLEVGAVSFYGPDAMSHRFWHGAFPEEYSAEVAALASPAEKTALRDVMRATDRAIGKLRARLSPEDTILIVSDHGFEGRSKPRDVWVPHLLQAIAREGLDRDRDGFTLVTQFNNVVLRVEPRPFEEAEATTTRLADLIDSFQTASGEPLFSLAEVLDVAERPAGFERSWGELARQWVVVKALDWVYDVQVDPNAHAVILAVPDTEWLAQGWPDAPVRVAGRETTLSKVVSRQLFSGSHDPTAVFLAAGGPVAAVPERGQISVLDVAPLVFHLAGLGVPDDLEGSVPVHWLDPEALAQRPVERVPASSLPGVDRAGQAGAQDDPELVEKLRRLGYLE